MNALGSFLATYGVYGGIALLATAILTPVAMRAAQRLGVMDIPDQQLKPHARPIPYLGGVAICAGWAAALLVALLAGVVQDARTLVPLLLGGTAMSMLGMVDDIRQVRPKTRLLVGAAIVTTVLLTTRVGFELAASVVAGVEAVCRDLGLAFPNPLRVTLHVVGVPLSILVSVFVVLGACNSANLIDGLDGLCSGVTAIISLGFFLLAVHLAAWQYSLSGDPVRMTLSVAMFGAALGFLLWNYNPAKIFMGDAGSMLLGFNCGVLILLFAEQPGILRWVIGALMIFALPVFDTALAMYRRWRAGRSIFEGDRSHFYDQLVQRGFTVRQTVLICYALTVFYAGTGLLLTWVHESPAGPDAPPVPVIRTRYAVLLYLGVWVATALAARWTGLTTPEEARRGATVQQPPSPAANAGPDKTRQSV